MKIFASLLPLLLLSTWPGCESEEKNTFDAGIKSTKAILRWQGELALDGCGFFVVFGGRSYKPLNEDIIPDSYKQVQETNVSISYLEHQPIPYACGLQAQELNAVKLLQLSLE